MNLSHLTPRQKIIIITVIFLTFIITASVFVYVSNNTGNRYGDGFQITGIDKISPNLPRERYEALSAALHLMVQKNNKPDDASRVSDASVRPDSIEYTYDTENDVHSGSFIIDVQSLKQSYFASYQWSPNTTNNIGLSGYTANVACLAKDKLIYGDFQCIDDFANSPLLELRDPIIDLLPHTTYNYIITANSQIKGEVELDVKIILYAYDTRNSTEQQAVQKYKEEINNWLLSNNLKPSDYKMNYTVY
jgi:hypothetical protein